MAIFVPLLGNTQEMQNTGKTRAQFNFTIAITSNRNEQAWSELRQALPMLTPDKFSSVW